MMPWAPRPEAATIAQRARVLARQGLDQVQIEDYQRRTRPEARPVDISNAARNAMQQECRIGAWEARGAGAQLPRAQHPRNAAIPEAYRYGVRFRFPDENGNTVYRDVFVESTRTLTIHQIVNAAEALYSELAPQYGRFSTLPISEQI